MEIPKTLKRYPAVGKDPLQAWDAADEFIVEHLNKQDLGNSRILILNDSFGALSSALEKYDVTTYTDSYLSYRAIQQNTKNTAKLLTRLEDLEGVFDWVLIRMPKSMSFLEDMLCHSSRHLSSNSKIICGYMIKHQAKASFDLLQKIIGTTTTSLAQKKARLIFASFERQKSESPYPLRISIESFKRPFLNHSNLFSREKLDIGTRFLLNHIPNGNFPVIFDLGCGNGVVGIMAKEKHPSSKVVFSDESKMAIASAQLNWESHCSGEASFQWTNCAESLDPQSVHLVICNPPFHEGTTLSSSVAWRMFTDARRVLTTGGVLRIIGNSHLRYQTSLKKLFGNCKLVASNKKFVILDARK